MARRGDRTSSSQAAKRAGALTRPFRESRALMVALGVAIIVPFAILFTLIALDVRLGQGYFAYRYSPVRQLRVPRGVPFVAIGALACAAVWGMTRARWRTLGLAGLFVAFALWGAWAFLAPPNAMTQQLYGMTSPSSDGAFVSEAMTFSSLAEYLRGFDARLGRSIEEMQGTRVLSNPPGMTILARAVILTSLGRDELARWLIEVQQVDPADAPRLADALRVGMVLCGLWAASGAVAYGLGREFLPPAGSAVFAIVAVFNPCAVHFVPGKDPAQLLTVCGMLWAWLAGWKRGSLGLAALAGAIGVLGATVSLIHIWVGVVMVGAMFWEGLAGGSSTRSLHGVIRQVVAAVMGALGVVALVYVAIGWNIVGTLIAVARRWGEIQKTFDMSRPVWFVIGLPIFLLFLPPGVYALVALTLRRRRMNFGTRLALCTIIVMAIIYVAIGVTYELPRLWVAFLPTLVLGLAIDRPLMRGNPGTVRPKVAKALVLIAAAQIVFTAMHWTLFDVREAEYRLISQRFYQ